ncbi:helix-turn-helix transcriptional regulator [Nocardioides plantarum]|uniref:Helix-turn-helix transcriptional regulator n=1 Tax=Nocardioides plantarum TaxID=29299 RepID=A0ABV5KJ26_9ACTN|nr:helix-turn-helix transcriptional regulator [Nocardioides plantarum]
MDIDDTSLGATLRTWRGRVTPAAAGLPDGRARRATGLRREDLAELSDISVDYVVRLEQGRATTPSAQVVAALARALQLSDAERDHLYRLAHVVPPGDTEIDDRLPVGLQRLVGRMGDTTAAAVFAADWQLIWWNRGWVALLGDPADREPHRRNFARDTFPVDDTGPYLSHWPVTSLAQQTVELAVVSDLRRATGLYPASARLRRLVGDLTAGNARFAELWATAAIGTHPEDRKVVEHPSAGPITVDCDVMLAGQTEQKVVVLSADEGSDDEARLRRALGAG